MLTQFKVGIFMGNSGMYFLLFVVRVHIIIYGIELHLDHRKYGCLVSCILSPEGTIWTSFVVFGVTLWCLSVSLVAILSLCNHFLQNFALVLKLCV